VHVVPLPHMRQLLIPQQGVRVVLASDGLWDLMTPEKAGSSCRSDCSAGLPPLGPR
jgi:serine/threonine protein phosphatase PrpC